MECSCTVSTDLDDYCTLLSNKFVRARKEHRCYECRDVIKVGDEYFKEATVHDEQFIEYKTCEHCYSLRQVFFSDGWYWGMLWEMFTEFVNDCAGEISITCILELTKVAKDRVLDIIEESWGDVEICPECGSLIEWVWAGGTRCTKCNYSEPPL